jgi:diacylglycerol kinase family enzyme
LRDGASRAHYRTTYTTDETTLPEAPRTTPQPNAQHTGGAPIPAIVNAKAGTADAAVTALREAGAAFRVEEVDPAGLERAVHAEVESGAERVLVAGGDGTIATAASVLVGTPVALAVLPGGTLNHFARCHAIPTEAPEALRVAAEGAVTTADVAYVNGRLFLNTSSVGAYELFVRTRERFERHVGYRLASIAAAIRVLFELRGYRVTLEVDGKQHVYRTPIVFIGVGERELKVPSLGDRVADGRRGLHVLVVRGRTAGRLFVLALAAASRGVAAVSRTPLLDSFVVDSVTIDMPRPEGNVAVDGELERMRAPLEYTLRRDALRVVTPG